ncbi:hypothetical protein Q1695_011783 [Nippostrongylus brasiliensis]|nr:hypothetical protein Q1695_011783 [Nippostrongylus brasiliensis]
MVTSPDTTHYAYSSFDANIICALSSVTTRNDKNGALFGSFGGFHERIPEIRVAYSNPVLRQLLIEMHFIFEKCQQLSQHERLNAVETLSISREYRSALLHCVKEIGSESEEIFMRDFTIWSLFETMFFSQGDTPICLDLISWGMESFSFIDKVVLKASKELDDGVSVENGTFWRAVFLLLLGCRFDVCIDFLNVLKGDEAATRFVKILESFDWKWIADEAKRPKVDRWRNNLSELLAADAFKGNRQILLLAQLLNGDRKRLQHVACQALGEWWHLMPFYTFITNPGVTYGNMGSIAEECRELFHGTDDNEKDDFDPFLAIFSMKDTALLQNIVVNPWLSLHLIDTLYHTDSEHANLPTLAKIRELLLLEYGSGLIQNSCLWEVGLDYLLQCGSEGRLCLENHIEAMHIEDDEMAENLLRICVEQELDDSKACIVNTMTYRYLRDNEWSAALSWALRGARGPALDNVVSRIVCYAEKSGTSCIANLSLLDHLADYVMEINSPSLVFLFNYYRFHRSLSAGDVRSHAPLLVSMITSPNVPRSFHEILFRYLKLILADAPQVKIPAESIYELISFFRQYSIDDVDEEDDTKKDMVRSLNILLLNRLCEAEMAAACAQ